jgi:formamidopyrimidine-DNA glycosylase
MSSHRGAERGLLLEEMDRRMDVLVSREHGKTSSFDPTLRVYHRTPRDCVVCGKRFLNTNRSARSNLCSEACRRIRKRDRDRTPLSNG